jgi:hypothetical protein
MVTILQPDFRVNLTAELVRSYGMVIANPTIVGKKGQAVPILLHPYEVASRAADLAQETYQILLNRGWAVPATEPVLHAEKPLNDFLAERVQVSEG